MQTQRPRPKQSLRPRTALRTISVLLAAFILSSPAFAFDVGLWGRYKANFISNEGRVIDFLQGQTSHSEGQGYAMLLAVAYDDRELFDKLWGWTTNNLSVRTDSHLAWQWGKRPNGQWGVIDYNNATDGDILIASALLKADAKWHKGLYRDSALRIVKDIRRNLAITQRGRTFLLPSYYGFVRESGVVLNPSYLVLPALRRFAEADDRAFWERVYRDSSTLLAETCFGSLCLPADWVMLEDARITVFKEKSPYFGADAIRTILHIASEQNARYPAGVQRLLAIYRNSGYIPGWVDLENDGISLKPAPAGYYAVFALAAKKTGDPALAARLLKEASDRLAGGENDYYSLSLYLLATNDGVL